MSCRVLFLLAAHYFVVSIAQVNVTIDDSDPAIAYTGNWEISLPSDLDAGGSHHLTGDDGSSASFKFTGSAVYFMSPLWPYDVFTQLQLDSQPPVQLNLSDPNQRSPIAEGPETVRSAVVWSSENLPNVTHTLLISKIRQPDRPYAVVDTIIYTVLTPTPPPPTITSSTSSTSPASTSVTRAIASPTNTSNNSNDSSTSSSSHALPIALGSVLGSLGLFMVIAAVWCCHRRRRRPRSEAWIITGASPESQSPPSGPLPPNNPQPQTMYIPYSQGHESSPNASWSGSDPRMSGIGVPLVTNMQPHGYHPPGGQPSQNFNPWVGLPPPTEVPYQQHHDPYPQQATFRSYAPTTLSTITETSTPGTLGSNRAPLGSPASFPSADPSFYTPPQDTGGGARLSYASDIPAGAAAPAMYQHHYPYPSGSAAQLRSPEPSSSSAVRVGKNGKERNMLTAVNRDEEDAEGLRPPAYTPK